MSRPVVIVQVNTFDHRESVTICPLAADERSLEIVRVSVQPHSRNGLSLPSLLLGDQVTTLPKARLGKKLGVLDPEDMRRLETAVLTFLGLA